MTRGRQVVVSVHDVAPPHEDRVRRMLDLLTALGVSRRSLLVIPDYHGRSPIDRDEQFCDWLRERHDEGDEIVLHGYEHIGVAEPRNARERFQQRWCTKGEGEFLSLEYDEAHDRLQRGLGMMLRAGLSVHGFVAPAWLINDDGMRAARRIGLQYTNSYATFIDLSNDRSYVAPSLVFGPGHLDEDLGVAVQAKVCRLMAWYPLTRVVLHPPCIDHPGRMSRIATMIERLTRDHAPVTYFEMLSTLRAAELDRAYDCAR